MKKAKGVYRGWEIAMVEEKATMEEVQEMKHKYKRGVKPSGALVDLFTRLFTEKEIEDPMKFVFPNMQVAQNFRDACAKHVHLHLLGKKDIISINRCDATVYIFRTA